VIKFTSCLPMVWFSPGTLASSTTKTGPHDIAEILLKVAFTKNQSINLLDFGNVLTVWNFWFFVLLTNSLIL